MSLPAQHAQFQLRDRQIDPARNSIAGPEGEAGVEPKVMAVLLVLAGEPGRVFARGELIDLVWGTEYGADESLTRAISLLRKALGDTRGEPLVIETISKRGYRLLPEAVAAVPAPSSAAARSPRRVWGIALGAFLGVAGTAGLLILHPFTGTKAPEVIAVTVDLVNPVRRDSRDMGFAKSLTVDLVAALSQEKRFHVTAKHPDPASRKNSGLRYSIYADLQTDGGKVKSEVEIMDTDSGRALWSHLYEQNFDGSLAAQDSLVGKIAHDLIPALLSIAQARAALPSAKP